MFSAVIYVIICIAFVLQFVWALYLFVKKPSYHLALFLLFIFGLFYDGFIISIGYLVGAGALLQFISWFRFLFHVLLTPICIIVVFELGVDHEVFMGEKVDIKTQRIIAWVFYLFFMLFGLFTHFIGIELGIIEFDGVLRYTQLNAMFPIASVLVCVVVLILGIQFGRKTNWKVPWILIGIIVMILGAMVPSSKYGTAPGSFVEMILALSILVVYHINYKKK